MKTMTAVAIALPCLGSWELFILFWWSFRRYRSELCSRGRHKYSHNTMHMSPMFIVRRGISLVQTEQIRRIHRSSQEKNISQPSNNFIDEEFMYGEQATRMQRQIERGRERWSVGKLRWKRRIQFSLSLCHSGEWDCWCALQHSFS